MEQRGRGCRIIGLVCVWSILASVAQCSSGDRKPEFSTCVNTCLSSGCVYAERRHHGYITQCNKQGVKPDFFLTLLGWDCLDDCRYSCMWGLETNKKMYNVGEAEKYYGKWPFYRVLGVQELCSVLASAGNLLALYFNILKFLHRTQAVQMQAKSMYPYTWIWMLQTCNSMNSWVWSIVFHSRDTKTTEKFDYFSADLVALTSLYIALVRVLQLKYRWRVLLAAVGMSFLFQHMYWMTYVKFDYGYNMMVCLALGCTTNMMLMFWAWRCRHPGRRTLTMFMVGLHLGMLFEINDFPPLFGLLDAHAVWHFATIPLTFVWFVFLNSDVEHLCKGPTEKDAE